LALSTCWPAWRNFDVERLFFCPRTAAREEAMFDSKFVDLPDRHSDEPLVAGTLPWQVIALLICLTILSVLAAIFYPDIFGTPVEQF
jgi:hypothetical protein